MLWIWIGFFALIIALLALDLGVLNRKAHVIGVTEALLWTGFWIVLALLFDVAVYYIYEHDWAGIAHWWGAKTTSGWEAAMIYLGGYLLEKSLSIDNIFVIALIFAYFQVPRQHQHRTLFWGIVGALLLRGAMIWGGTALLHYFTWIMYVFGAVLILTGLKMLRGTEEKVEPDRNPLVRLARRFYPISPTFEGQRFFTRVDGRRAVTPLFLVLLVVESTDVVFAVDSIPAIFGLTQDPFLVMTSNVFAILGLRSLFFALAAIMGKFHYLKFGLVLILVFIGVKMILGCETYPIYKVSTPISLAVVVSVLTISVVASLLWRPPAKPRPDGPP